MNETGRQENPQKPYPRHCCECGETAVTPTAISYPARIKHDGKLHEFTIAHLPIDQCEKCGEQYFTNATSDAKTTALREHLGLLQPSEIRDFLSRYHLTQRKLAAHLRVAEESVSRWLNGLSIQSRALDTLLRLYFTIDEVRVALASDTFPAHTPGEKPAPMAGPAVALTLARSRVRQKFGRDFSTSTIERSVRFELLPSRN